MLHSAITDGISTADLDEMCGEALLDLTAGTLDSAGQKLAAEALDMKLYRLQNEVNWRRNAA